jgi:hypothetical protein
VKKTKTAVKYARPAFILIILFAVWIALLFGCATVPPPAVPGTILEKVIEPRHASMVSLSVDGQAWVPFGEGREDEFFLVVEGRDSAGNPCTVRIQVEAKVWDLAKVGDHYRLPEGK